MSGWVGLACGWERSLFALLYFASSVLERWFVGGYVKRDLHVVRSTSLLVFFDCSAMSLCDSVIPSFVSAPQHGLRSES